MAAATAALLIGTVISTGVSAWSQNQAGKAQQAIADRNADAMRAGAAQNAMEARESGSRQRINNERIMGAMRARLAGQGGVISTGTDLDIAGETAARLKVQELDAFRSASLQQQAMIEKAQESEWEGKIAAQTGKIKAGTSLLSGLINTGQAAFRGYNSGSLLVGT